MTARLQVTPDITPDPNATPRVDIVATANGVAVDPALTPAPVVKPAAGERPSWLPEKFKTVEEMASSYTELEKKLGSPAPKPDPAAPSTVTPEAAAKAGIDLPALSKEFAEKGELSAETLASLDKAGFNKASVDSYIAGQKAIATQIVTSLEAIAGGSKELTALLEWANTNLSAEDAAAYNVAHDSGNVDQLKLALKAVKAQYTEANGVEPKLIDGGESVRTGDVQGYESQAQIIADMRKPEYKKDPSFRAKVQKRLDATGTFGASLR